MHNIDKAIGDEVRAARNRRNLRQQDVALVLGISDDTFSHKETGQAPFKARELQVIADYLKVPVTDLYPDTIPTHAA